MSIAFPNPGNSTSQNANSFDAGSGGACLVTSTVNPVVAYSVAPTGAGD